ncbi:MAG: tyrosine--tRNA ligase [Candidatus Aenigmarchaeota archaeon]|nr:tyrosine--tRNA ligase [Candidatus Aenigmarchaeota archaeon]
MHFKIWIADWFAWINNKMGGDLEKIQKVGEYFVEVWKAAGVDTKKVEVIWASEAMDKEYWKRALMIAKNTTVKRATRAITIMGRREGELSEVAQYFYPIMQANDAFHLEVDICQLGLDQRRAGMLARDAAEKLKWKKPVIVSHHMLMSLQGMKEPEGFDENKNIDKEISSKMSKSRPETCIYVHDSFEEIQKKLRNAFCPEKAVDNNPILDYCKHIILRKFHSIKISRKKPGDILEFHSYHDLEKAYRAGEIHPLDLKIAVGEYLDRAIAPIREHFEHGKARLLYETVKGQEITR